MRKTPEPSNYPEGHAPVSEGRGTFADAKRTVARVRDGGAKVSTLTVSAELERGTKGAICTHYAVLMREEASRPDISSPVSPVLQVQIDNVLSGLNRDFTAQLVQKLEDAQTSLEAVACEWESYVEAAAVAETRTPALQLFIAEQKGVVEELRELSKTKCVQLVEGRRLNQMRWEATDLKKVGGLS